MNYLGKNLFDKALIFYTNQIDLSYYMSPFMIIPFEYRLVFKNDSLNNEGELLSSTFPESLLLFKEPIGEQYFERAFSNKNNLYPVALKMVYSEAESKNIEVYLIKKDGSLSGKKKLIDLFNGDYMAAIFPGVIPLTKVCQYIFRSESDKAHFLSFISPFQNVYFDESMTIVDEAMFKGSNDIEYDMLKEIKIVPGSLQSKEDIGILNRVRALLFRLLNDFETETNNGILLWHLNKNIFDVILPETITKYKAKKRSQRSKNSIDVIKSILELLETAKYRIESELVGDIEIPYLFGIMKRINIKEYVLHLMSKSRNNKLREIVNYDSEEELFDSFCFLKISEFLINNDVRENKSKKELIDLIAEYIMEKLQEYIEEDDDVDFQKIDYLKAEYADKLSKIRDAINYKVKYVDVISELPVHMKSLRALTELLWEKGAKPVEKDNNKEKKNKERYDANYIVLRALADGFTNSLDKEERKKLDIILFVDVLLSIILEKCWPYYEEEKKNIKTEVDNDAIYLNIGKSRIPCVRIVPIKNLVSRKIMETIKDKNKKQEITIKIIDLVKKAGLLFYSGEYGLYFKLLAKRIIIDNKDDNKYQILFPRNEIISEEGKIRFRLEEPEVDTSEQSMEIFFDEIQYKESNLLANLISDAFACNKEVTKSFIKNIISV